jgi:hypothetical protein
MKPEGRRTISYGGEVARLRRAGLPNPAIWLPKPRTELRYRHCDIYGRIDVAVFSRSLLTFKIR